MIKQIVGRLLFFLFLLAFQVLVLNQIHLLRLAMPFVYIYFLMKLPSGFRREFLMLLAFLTGVAMDCFFNTPGMHAAACTAMAFLHPKVVHLLIDKELAEGIPYSYATCGYRTFFLYIFALTAIHHTTLLLIESMTFFNFGFLMWRLLLNTLSTGIAICLLELLNIKVTHNEWR